MKYHTQHTHTRAHTMCAHTHAHSCTRTQPFVVFYTPSVVSSIDISLHLLHNRLRTTVSKKSCKSLKICFFVTSVIRYRAGTPRGYTARKAQAEDDATVAACRRDRSLSVLWGIKALGNCAETSLPALPGPPSAEGVGESLENWIGMLQSWLLP